jgi:hypothetical protein
MLGRLAKLLALAGAGFAGVLAYRGRLRSGKTLVDVHYDDGSFFTFGPRSAEGQRLLPHAQRALGAVHRA